MCYYVLLNMTKWVTTYRDYQAEGVAITLECARAGIKLHGFQNWKHEGKPVGAELYEQLEHQILGGFIDPAKIICTHTSNHDLSNLIVTEIYSYPSLDIQVSQHTSDEINQFQARQMAYEKLVDAIWDKRLSEIEAEPSL